MSVLLKGYVPSRPMEMSSGQKLLLNSMHRNRIRKITHSVTPPLSRLRYALVRSISVPV